MTYSIIASSAFERASEQFQRQHPELRARLGRVLQDLTENPHNPRLRLHPLRGRLQGQHAISINYQYRITLELHAEERRVILLDIGDHDDVYRGGSD